MTILEFSTSESYQFFLSHTQKMSRIWACLTVTSILTFSLKFQSHSYVIVYWLHWQISSLAFRWRHKVLISSLILKGTTVKTIHCPYAWHKKGIFVALILVLWEKRYHKASLYSRYWAFNIVRWIFCTNGPKKKKTSVQSFIELKLIVLWQELLSSVRELLNEGLFTPRTITN